MFRFPDHWAGRIAISTEHAHKGCPCWDWTGWNTGFKGRGAGYGKVRYQKRPAMAHRAIYCEMVGPIQEGLELDHLCKRRICVNPRHMEQVTRLENVLRSSAALYQTDDGYKPLSTITEDCHF